MDNSATLAKSENAKLLLEFQDREKKCYNLIRKQQSSYEALTKMKVEKEVISETVELEELNATVLLRKKNILFRYKND